MKTMELYFLKHYKPLDQGVLHGVYAPYILLCRLTPLRNMLQSDNDQVF